MTSVLKLAVFLINLILPNSPYNLEITNFVQTFSPCIVTLVHYYPDNYIPKIPLILSSSGEKNIVSQHSRRRYVHCVAYFIPPQEPVRINFPRIECIISSILCHTGVTHSLDSEGFTRLPRQIIRPTP